MNYKWETKHLEDKDFVYRCDKSEEDFNNLEFNFTRFKAGGGEVEIYSYTPDLYHFTMTAPSGYSVEHKYTFD